MKHADKTIEFGYDGGTNTQRLKVRNDNLPVTFECGSEWLSVSVAIPYVTITASPNYGLGSRSGSVVLHDRFGNSIAFDVRQDWFRDVRIECLDEIAIPYTYYNGRDSYDIYVTVYGGNDKSFKTKGLTKMTEKVWNASGTYQDYIIHIPHGTSGNYTLTHRNAEEYRQCCLDEGVEPDMNSVKRKLSIIQLTEDDMTGIMKIDVGGKHATAGSHIEVGIAYGSDVQATVKKCSYKRMGDDGAVHDVEESVLSVSDLPDWMKSAQSDGVISFTALSPNPFANERRADIKLSSPSNPKLYTTISFVQQSSSIRG